MGCLSELEPKKVFEYFEAMNQVPRGTFDTKRISDWLVAFAKEHSIECVQDASGNIVMKKAGSAGYENSEPVILQGHMDMVCEKTEDSTHDFSKDPIEMYVEDGFVKAKSTTLGADDGVAVAFALAVLTDKSIAHPPIEVIITVDEETGMGGANSIDMSGIKGKKLINIDSDVEGTIICGCAGGVRGKGKIPFSKETIKGELLEIQVKGLVGGHSGLDIQEQRGNANRLMGRLLTAMGKEVTYSLVDVNGGTLDNVICYASTANIVVDSAEINAVKAFIQKTQTTWEVEFDNQEPNLTILLTEKGTASIDSMTQESRDNVLFFLTCIPYGVQNFSRQLPDLVETSNNLGMVKTTETYVETWGQARSSIESKKAEVIAQVTSCAKAVGGTCETENDYPGWMFKSDSLLRPIVVESYKKCYGEEPIISTVHAGLECGILFSKKPDLDCISFGPNMHDCHSVRERLDIASAQRVWNLLLEVLKACK
ncbi:MAG: aminoacyl-histidine dipeptidase [Lachnospiraceae bacterium]